VSYSIIGFGAVGQALARAFARKNIDVTVASRRPPEMLMQQAQAIGPTVVPRTLQDAIASDTIFLAVPFWEHREVAKQITAWHGKTIIDETWLAKADDGSVLEVQLQFARGVPARGKVEAKLHSASKPDFYRIYKFEQVADVARSTATVIDRVSKFSIKATGPRFAPLFNGSEQLISITSVPSYSRSIYVPVM